MTNDLMDASFLSLFQWKGSIGVLKWSAGLGYTS